MAAPVGLQFGRDSKNLNGYAPLPSNTKYTATITDGTATTITLPTTSGSGFWIVSFRYYPSGSSVFVDVSGATAAVPASGSLTASTSEGNPASLLLTNGQSISMITSQTAVDVSVVAWQVGIQI